MTPEQFAYWLQGFAEIHTEPPTVAQWQVIRDHLAALFVKVTPDRVPSARPTPVFDHAEWAKVLDRKRQDAEEAMNRLRRSRPDLADLVEQATKPTIIC